MSKRVIYSFLRKIVEKIWKKIDNSDIVSRIFKDAFWSLLGSIFSRGLMLIASIVAARILGRTEYGELGMIRSTVNMFTVFAGFGFGLTATKYVAEFRTKDKVKTGRIIGLTMLFSGVTGAIIALVILMAAPFLAEKTINAPHLVNEIRLGAVMIFLSALSGIQTGVLVGFQAFKTIAKVNLISGALAFPLQIGFILLYGLPGSVIGFGFNFLLLWVINFVAVRKEVQKFDVTIQFENLWSEWPILYKFSLPALLSGVLVAPVLWACNVMLVNQPNGYEEMAIFDAANQWRNTILFIPVALSQIVLPLLSDSANNEDQFNRILKFNIIINFVISLIIAILVSLFSGTIMNTYGEGFADGRLVLIILIISTILVSVNGVVGQAIAGKGKMWLGFALNLIWALAILCISYYFYIIEMGAMGFAYAFLFSYTIHTLAQLVVLKWKILRS